MVTRTRPAPRRPVLATAAMSLLFLAPLPAPAGADPVPDSDAPAAHLTRLAEGLKEPRQRERLMAVLSGYGWLLRTLPLAQLELVTLDEGSLELRFDFGGKRKRAVTLPATRRPVVEPCGDGDPLTSGRVVFVQTRERTMLVRNKVLLQLNAVGISGVRAGDLEIKHGIFRPNVKLRTELRPPGAARDAEGRILLETDQWGWPVRRYGRWVPLEVRRWLVLEVHGHRFDLPVRSERENGEQRLAGARRERVAAPPTTHAGFEAPDGFEKKNGAPSAARRKNPPVPRRHAPSPASELATALADGCAAWGVEPALYALHTLRAGLSACRQERAWPW